MSNEEGVKEHEPTKPAEPIPLLPPSGKLDNLLKQVNDNDNLTEIQKSRLVSLINEKSEAFGVGYDDLTQTNLLKFHVNTGDAKPVMKRPYPGMTHSEQETLRTEINEMVSSGVLVPAMHSSMDAGESSWAFQVMYVPKKTGDKRLVTMFQDLNKVTVKDPWPLPLIVDLIESFYGAKWFSALDLLKGFHAIAVDEKSIPKLTIATPFGNYSYTCMPFGVINGPATFSRAIYLALQDFIPSFCQAYIDDCTVFSSSFEDHIVHLNKVLDRLIEVKMKLNPNKCNLFTNSIEFLGFQVSVDGVLPLKSKVEKALSFPPPKNKTDIRAFINMIGFYRRHIPNFSEYTINLTNLLKKTVEFQWNEDRQREFDKLKQALVNATMLKFPDHNKKYRVYTDASNYAIGCALVQVDDDNVEYPIAFISRKVNSTEFNWPIVEKELLALTMVYSSSGSISWTNNFKYTRIIWRSNTYFQRKNQIPS